ncbi:hypothetical protein CROQUDRAFT_50878 [Cronartium quercuum f. sp. fusiforme G11]|uniref:Uncharacterized protein n=1 Tax=Cronartium quercuum f. sp. fusiforme G11 TaxID=708437 RepID=A0A9P6NE81_9BASI|nr:hypothetical protein CROQUDRAFT_50878 [Cronartium quercuum f. sp. fusiforme G11]
MASDSDRGHSNSNSNIKLNSPSPKFNQSTSSQLFINTSDQIQQSRWNREIEEDHRFGGTHWLPLFLALIPSLGSLFHGDSESWTDGLVLLLVAFFLYKATQVPWQLYASARTTRILTSIHTNRTQLANDPASQNVIHALPDLAGHTTELERLELLLLLLTVASPALGVLLLFGIQSRLELSFNYLNSNATILFLLASLLKPLAHIHHLLLARATYLQSKLHFPDDLLTELKITANRLSTRITALETSAVSKYELKLLKKNFLNQPVDKLSTTLARQIEGDDQRRRQATDQAAEIARSLARLEARLKATAASLNGIMREQDRLRSSGIYALAQMVLQMIRVTESEEEEKAKEKKKQSAAYVERLPSDTESEEIEELQPLCHSSSRKSSSSSSSSKSTKVGSVEFISLGSNTTNKRSKVKPSTDSWCIIMWPLKIWFNLAQGILNGIGNLVWTQETKAEFERLSEINYQKDRAAIPGYQRPFWPGWTTNSHNHSNNSWIERNDLDDIQEIHEEDIS